MNIDYNLYPGRILEKKEYEQSNTPIISIITGFYNDEKYIMETAYSVLNQTFPYFEWIIVNDGSTEKSAIETLEKIKNMDDRIIIINKENEGVSVARDYGMKFTNEQSKYVMFLDSDDLLNKTYLECAYWTLETNVNASFAYTDVLNFGEREFKWVKYYTPEQEKKDNILVLTSLIRKKDFLKVGGFDTKEKDIYEDWMLWLKMMKEGMYPVRMSFLGFWYRQKNKSDSQLQRANKNREKLLKDIYAYSSKIDKRPEAIQYPKQDFNWDKIVDNIDTIVVPKEKHNNKIKILLIIPWMTVGGADKFNLDVISRVDKSKYEFIVISTLPNSNPWRQKFEEFATVYDLTTFLDRKYWISFLEYIICKENINIIFNTNSTFGYASLPYLKARHPEIPIIDYIHMEEWYLRNGGYSRDSAAIDNVIDKTYLCNANSAKILVNYFGKNEEEVKTLYIGVDEKKFDPELYNKKEILKSLKLNISDEKKIIGFICRIAEQKRPYLFVEILKELKKRRKDFIAVVAGDGPMLNEIKAKVKSSQLNEHVIFLGNISKTEEIYSICDITLNCSIKEGLALTSYESLAMGVPVITSDVGGQKELINEDVGIVVKCMQNEKEIKNFKYDKDEVNLYVDGIEKIFNSLEKYKKQCRARILNGFTIDNMIKNIEEIFDFTAKNPNKNKIEIANQMKENIKITKELLTLYFETYSKEYEWLSEDFNKNNVDMPKIKELKGKYNPMYEHTWQYKLKHPVVLMLRKIGIYELCKKLVGKGE